MCLSRYNVKVTVTKYSSVTSVVIKSSFQALVIPRVHDSEVFPEMGHYSNKPDNPQHLPAPIWCISGFLPKGIISNFMRPREFGSEIAQTRSVARGIKWSGIEELDEQNYPWRIVTLACSARRMFLAVIASSRPSVSGMFSALVIAPSARLKAA